MAKKGRGWHGDSEGHAKAGRKGGRARSKSNDSDSGRESNLSQEDRVKSGRRSWDDDSY